jgi:uncharacterized membrane-anchored protein YhcB (DUF1043 family)
MSEQNYSVDRDLKEAQAMAAALVPYVYEEELYGRVGLNMPSLTIGALLMRLRRLQVLRDKLNSTQAATLEQVERQIEGVRQEWTTHYHKKVLREIDARLRDIQTYMRECKEDPKLCANAYMPEALRRTIVQELLAAVPPGDEQSTGLAAKTKQVDSELRRYVKQSNFIWSPELQPVYTPDTYWWLYSRPPQPDETK